MLAKIFVSAGLILIFTANLTAVDNRKVAIVQNKDVLDSSDFVVIDNFVDDAIRELIDAKDFSEISRLRSDIIANSVAKNESSKAQYHNQFTKSAAEHISAALKSSQSLPADKKFKVVLNLLMIIEGLGDIQLSSLVVDKIDDDNAAFRYWAIKCFASPEVIKQLNDAGENSVSAQVVSRINKVIDKSDDTLLVLISGLASEIKSQSAVGGTELLIRIADLRIKQYEQWQVNDEITDAAVLKALYNKIVSGEGGADMAKRFCNLYSFVCQRYLKGVNLSAAHKDKLITVMVEIEDKCISKLLVRQTKIREAIQKKDMAALQAEIDRLLGDANTEGKLPVKLNIQYRGPDGKESTAPAALPAPPK